jgi:hypothetical protein
MKAFLRCAAAEDKRGILDVGQLNLALLKSNQRSELGLTATTFGEAACRSRQSHRRMMTPTVLWRVALVVAGGLRTAKG